MKTDIGFKRVVNRDNPLQKGYERAFVKCKRCKNRAFYDFIPFSLSNPIMFVYCGHDFGSDYKPF